MATLRKHHSAVCPKTKAPTLTFDEEEGQGKQMMFQVGETAAYHDRGAQRSPQRAQTPFEKPIYIR